MRFREFVKEADALPGTVQGTAQPKGTATPADNKTANNPDNTSAPQDPELVSKLTAGIADLQKQIKDLQKASLQQLSQQSKPGEAGQAQASVKPVGTGQATPQVTPTTQQPAQQQQPAVAGQKPPLGQPQGQPMGQAPAANPKPVPGVNQPPAVTKMNLQKDLTKNIAGGK